MKIIKQFQDKGFTYEHAIADNAVSIPVNHHAYNYTWALVDKYTDKKHLFKSFEEYEKDIMKINGRYQLLNKLYEDEDLYLKIRMWKNEIQQSIISEEGNMSDVGPSLLMRVSSEYGDEDWCTKSFLNELKSAKTLLILNDPKALKRAYEQECAPIKIILENRFSEAIWEKYHLDDENQHFIDLPLHSDMQIILNTKQAADSHFLEMKRQLDFDKTKIRMTRSDKAGVAERRYKITKLLEKNFNLLYNPKNQSYYISNGQGMMIDFDPKNDKYIFNPLHNKFQEVVNKKDGEHTYDIIFSRPDFYKLAHQYCIAVQEPERFLVGFNNCCYNAEEQKIYELDYRFPRLPMKRSGKNFVFDRDLTGQGGALEKAFNYCLHPDDQDRILTYLGRALFEEGYTEHQEILMFLGKGGTGKTSFATALSQIFNTVASISSDKMSNDNKFAFSQLPTADFLIMDEITNAKPTFIEMMKYMSNGSESLPIELKNQNVFDLPAEYVPMMFCIGNRLNSGLYKKFSESGVSRRFCIIFLKHSVLEAKEVLDEDGNIIRRTSYKKSDLMKEHCIEWLLQKVVLHYDKDNGDLLSEDEAERRAKMAAFPEEWVIENFVTVERDEQDTMSTDENGNKVYAEDLLKFIRKKINEYMLEGSIKDPSDQRLIRALENGLDMREIKGNYEVGSNKYFFLGVSYDEEQ